MIFSLLFLLLGEPLPGQMLIPQGYSPPVLHNGVTPNSLQHSHVTYPHYNSLPALGVIPPIIASGPAAEYNSSSAESLDEIPIENSTGMHGRPLLQGLRGYPFHHRGNINPAASYPGIIGPPVVPQYYRYMPSNKPMRMPMMRLPLRKPKQKTKRQAVIKEVSPVTSNIELDDSPVKQDQSKDKVKEDVNIKDEAKIKAEDCTPKDSSQNQDQSSGTAGIQDQTPEDQHQDNQEQGYTTPDESEQERLQRMSRRALSLR